MEAERAEGTSGPAGAQEKLSPAWVISPLFPLPTELPNTYFERMADGTVGSSSVTLCGYSKDRGCLFLTVIGETTMLYLGCKNVF